MVSDQRELSDQLVLHHTCVSIMSGWGILGIVGTRREVLLNSSYSPGRLDTRPTPSHSILLTVPCNKLYADEYIIHND